MATLFVEFQAADEISGDFNFLGLPKIFSKLIESSIWDAFVDAAYPCVVNRKTFGSLELVFKLNVLKLDALWKAFFDCF